MVGFGYTLPSKNTNIRLKNLEIAKSNNRKKALANIINVNDSNLTQITSSKADTDNEAKLLLDYIKKNDTEIRFLKNESEKTNAILNTPGDVMNSILQNGQNNNLIDLADLEGLRNSQKGTLAIEPKPLTAKERGKKSLVDFKTESFIKVNNRQPTPEEQAQFEKEADEEIERRTKINASLTNPPKLKKNENTPSDLSNAETVATIMPDDITMFTNDNLDKMKNPLRRNALKKFLLKVSYAIIYNKVRAKEIIYAKTSHNTNDNEKYIIRIDKSSDNLIFDGSKKTKSELGYTDLKEKYIGMTIKANNLLDVLIKEASYQPIPEYIDPNKSDQPMQLPSIDQNESNESIQPPSNESNEPMLPAQNELDQTMQQVQIAGTGFNKKKQQYANFGNLYLDQNALKKNKLVIRPVYTKNNIISQANISPILRKMIFDIKETLEFDKTDYYKLEGDEKRIIEKIIRFQKNMADVNIEKLIDKDILQMKKRLEILTNEINAGNISSIITREMKAILKKLFELRDISYNKYTQSIKMIDNLFN